MNLRQQLAEARASLRTAKDALETAKTVATLEVGGKNEAERKSNAALALLKNDTYTEALAHVRNCEAAVERVEADIAEQEYQLRVREVAARERTGEEHALRLREVAARERLAEALVGKKVDDGVVDRIAFEAGRVAGRQVAHEMRRQGSAVVSTPSRTETPQIQNSGHKWLVHHNCEDPYCNICESGLDQCTVCGAADYELPSECPGVRMTPEQHEAVCAGTLDYQAGQWIKTTPSDSVDWYEEQNQADHRRIAAMEAAQRTAPDTTEWFGR